MTKNNAGGYGWEVDLLTSLDRFLILGTEGGTYHVGEQKLTADAVGNVIKAIKSDGHDVSCVASGQAVFPALEDYEPDLILLDIVLPDLSGYEVVKKLKADKRHQHVPVILVTGLEDRGLFLRWVWGCSGRSTASGSLRGRCNCR